MRSQGEAELAIEQGETRYEGVTWTTRRQIAANRLIPLPEPARRGLINLADEVIATTTGLSPRPPKSTPATSRDRLDPIEQRTADAHSSPFRSPARKIQRRKDHAGETACHHRAERGSVCWRRTYCLRFVHLDTTLRPPTELQWCSIRVGGVTGPGRKGTRSRNRQWSPPRRPTCSGWAEAACTG
jgi:hypothetical protein